MTSRRVLVVLMFAAACGRKASHAPAPSAPSAPAAPAAPVAAALPLLATQVPTVSTVDVLLVTDDEVPSPPVLVRVSADGTLAVADAPRTKAWRGFDQPPTSPGVQVRALFLPSMIREAILYDRPIEPMAQTALDHPPPVEVEEEEDTYDAELPDESDDESGGTGTAMALEEGKLGRKATDEQRAREQAIAQARAAGLIGDGSVPSPDSLGVPLVERVVPSHGGGFGTGRSGFGYAGMGAPLGSSWPRRANEAVGRRARTPEKLAAALIVAAPQAKAAPIVDLLSNLDNTYLAVAHQGRLRALRVGYGLHQPGGDVTATRWIEVRFGAGGLTVEAVPSPAVTVPWASGPLDTAALAKAYGDARSDLGGARLDVDVLVAPDTDMQHLVDVLAALDAAGAEFIVLGDAPADGSPEAGKRGKHLVLATLGQPSAVGDLDKAVIRAHIKLALPQIKACYEQALLTNPTLDGTVTAQFFIAPNGKVAASKAAGVDPKVASCVAGAIKAITFPKPKGGGGVQVNYPFTFRN